jgi:FtsH-binding integral membrane protein
MQPNRQIGRGQTGSTAMYQDAIRESTLATNKVLKNTYLLLSATLIFSAMMAGVAMATDMPHPGLMISLIGMFGLLFLTQSSGTQLSDCCSSLHLPASWGCCSARC